MPRSKYNPPRVDFSFVTAVAALLIAAPLFSAAPALAQVVISLGTQGYYDDNIFLESGTPIPITPDNAAQAEQLSEQEIEQIDGEKNSSWITNPTVTLSTAKQLGHYGNLQMSADAGFLLYSSYSDENRMTLNTMVHYDSSEAFIPKPFYLTLEDSIQSQAADITVVEGSASQQTEMNQALLNVGVRQVKLAKDTDMGASYQFQVNTYLGDFLLSGGDNGLLQDEGSDYIQNSVNMLVDHQVTKSLQAGLYGNLAMLSYTSTANDPLQPTTDSAAEDQDRIQSSDGVRLTYKANEKLEFGSSAGVDYSRFTNDPPPQDVVVIAPDGTVSTISEPVSDNDTSFAYTGSVKYSPFLWTSVMADARQAITNDIDGDQFTTQVYSLNLTQGLTDWSALGGSVRYTGFDRQDSLGDPTDRIELLATIRFTLTESITLVAGYSYVDQNADTIPGQVLVESNEYTDNRIFIGLSAGIVGLPG